MDTAVLAEKNYVYVYQLFSGTGCRLEDLSEAMSDRERWRESKEYVLWVRFRDYDVLPRSPVQAFEYYVHS